MHYNWQHPQWPNFTYDISGLEDMLRTYLIEANKLLGASQTLDHTLVDETLIDIMLEEAISTSEIEGEDIQVNDVRSSLKYQMGLLPQQPSMKDTRAENISALMLDVRKTFQAPLTQEMLWKWHGLILCDLSQKDRLEVGKWRIDPSPMQIISGAVGREKVFFEAPQSDQVPQEMNRFIQWFNQTDPQNKPATPLPGPVRSAIAHLYFESIHPFADGNGRVGRAIAEKALSQDLGHPVLLSLSKMLYKNRKNYYEELSLASGYTLDITQWIHFFTQAVLKAQFDAQEKVFFTIKKARFWKRYEGKINDRQEKTLRRMFQEGPEGFIGGMNTRKYMVLTGCSKATATRDLTDLLALGCFQKREGEGRSTSYQLSLD